MSIVRKPGPLNRGKKPGSQRSRPRARNQKSGTRDSKSGSQESDIVEVAAGLVFREGRLLITQRQPGSHLAGLWEFPGGKRHSGETFRKCLIRELREELGIEVELGRLFERVKHAYPDCEVSLRFYCCRWKRREPRALGCAAFRWITAADLGQIPFPAADARLIRLLRRAGGLWK